MRILVKISILVFLLLSCESKNVNIISSYSNGQIKEQLIKGLDTIPKNYDLKQIFYSDGKLKCQGSKYKSKREGSWKCYHKNGELKWSSTFKDGEEHGTVECYYENGTWKKTNVKHGILEGKTIEYNYDSMVNEFYYVEGEYVNGKETGKWINKYENHSIMGFTNYVSGVREGDFEQFHKNGKISVKGRFENDEIQDSLYIYDDSSELERIELFDNGKLIRTIKMR